MKNIVFLVLLFCVNNLIYGQNNLSFSQAMIIDLPAFTQAPLTVPPNKVWKIEANAQNSGGNPRFTINDLAFQKEADSGPIWLNSGHTIKQGSGTPPAVRASVIEFEVSAGSGSAGGGSGYGSEGLAFAGVVNEVLNINTNQGQGTGTLIVPPDKIYKITYANGVIVSPVTGSISYSSASIFLGYNRANTSTGSPVEIYLGPGSHVVHHMGSGTNVNSAIVAINGISYFIQ